MLKHRSLNLLYYLLVIGLFLVACTQQVPQQNLPGYFLTPTPTPFRPITPTPAFASSPTSASVITATAETVAAPTTLPLPAPNLPLVWFSPAIPDSLRIGFGATPSTGQRVEAALTLDLAPEGEITWIYALVGAFPTVEDDVSADDLRRAWRGERTGPFTSHRLVMEQSTLQAFTALWGTPDPDMVLVAGGDWVDALWTDRNLWAIVPFENLLPTLKVISFDGNSPIHNDFDASIYPLIAQFTLQTSTFSTINLPVTNRDSKKLTNVVMTGVTALVRATANKMEVKGITYPAQDIRDWLVSADITHISNEIPFAENCPPPNPYQDTLVFCSAPKYIELLEYVGTDVVELTGNHFMDWGADATLLTVQMYNDEGWPYYGGGEDLTDARQPAFLEHNGNRFAFLGCNPVGPGFAWATDYNPGAAACDNYVWLEQAITHWRSEGYIPIVTLQYNEYYVPYAPVNQIRDYRALADAGAIIVSGSQSHFPQAMSFYVDAFIHYGLGNLFFDQMYYTLADGSTIDDTRLAFIDRHVFYDGRYISTELLTTVLEDFARPRPMTPAERSDFLRAYFEVSGW